MEPVVVRTVRLFPEAVTAACATGVPLLVTIPLRKALALTAFAGAKHASVRIMIIGAAAKARRSDRRIRSSKPTVVGFIDNRVSLSNSQGGAL